MAVDNDVRSLPERWRVATRVFGMTCIVGAIVAMRVLVLMRVGVDDVGFFIYGWLAPLVYLIPGVVVVARRDGHPIGWLLCLLALNIAFSFSSAVGVSAVAAGEAWLVWLLDVNEGSLGFLLFVALMVVFPDGSTARTARHRHVGRVALLLSGLATALELFVAQVTVSDAGAAVLDSPLPGAVVPYDIVAGGMTLAFDFAAMLVALVALVGRYRISHATERRQYRWVLWSLALLVGSFVFGVVGSAVSGDQLWVWAPTTAAFVVVPVAFMVAIMHFRLYEIDRLVSRSVSYVVLTMLLVGVYSAIAVVPAVVADVRSDLLVAAATLAAAAVFQPLRRRVQTVVDRRFDRVRYDASRTLDAFGATLRGATDLADLERDLQAVLRRSVQPAHVALWLASRHD